MPRNEDILGWILAGGIGHLLAQESFNEWKPFMDQFRERFQQMTYAKTPLPWAFLKSKPNIQAIYRQSVYCYLFGLPDACLQTLLKVLELSLISKHEIAEGKKMPSEMGLAKLIDWAEVNLKEDSKMTHSLRLLSNLGRADKMIPEQDCLESIGHVSRVLETLFPSENIVVNVVCHYCRNAGTASVLSGNGYLGNKMILECSNCKKNYHWMIMP